MAPTTNLCSNCSKEAHLICSACNHAPATSSSPTSNAQRTWYCSVACQKEHRGAHKKICQVLKERKKLFRAGEIVQEMFYHYRTVMFDKLVEKVEHRDGKVYVHEGRYEYGNVVSACNLLTPFPHHLCSNSNEKNSLLAHLSCIDALAWLHEQLALLLSPLTSPSDIRELSCHVANQRHSMIAVAVNGEIEDEREHVFLFVKTKMGKEEFAIDLSGAQYGWYEPVIPWEIYRERVRMLVSVPEGEEFGGMRERLTAESREQDGGVRGHLFGLNHIVSGYLAKGIKYWEEVQNMSVKEMLGLDNEEKFGERKRSLLGTLRVFVEEAVGEIAEVDREARAVEVELGRGEIEREVFEERMSGLGVDPREGLERVKLEAVGLEGED